MAAMEAPVIKAENFLKSESSEISKYESLFRAVIAQAIIDIKSNNERFKKEKYDAEKWIFHNKKDFKKVCELAGLNDEYVRKSIIRFLNE